MSEDEIPLADLFRVPMPPPAPPKEERHGPLQAPVFAGDAWIGDENTPPERLRALWRAVIYRAIADGLGVIPTIGSTDIARSLVPHQAANWFESRGLREICAAADFCPLWVAGAYRRARLLVENGVDKLAVLRAIEVRLLDAYRRTTESPKRGNQNCAG